MKNTTILSVFVEPTRSGRFKFYINNNIRTAHVVSYDEMYSNLASIFDGEQKYLKTISKMLSCKETFEIDAVEKKIFSVSISKEKKVNMLRAEARKNLMSIEDYLKSKNGV